MSNYIKGVKQGFSALRDVAYVAFAHLCVLLAVLSSVVLGSRPLPVLARVRSSRRAAGMLEYALIALIAVGIFVFLRGFFETLFERLTGNITNKLDSPNNSGL